MFTGLIETAALVHESRAGSLLIDLHVFQDGIDIGASVAINGVCLTVAEKLSGGCRFDVSSETSNKTTLGDLHKNDIVNVERAMKISDRLWGHFVTGHVDGIGTLRKITPESLDIFLPEHLRNGVVEKGSITIDGISLTVASVTQDGFSAAIIPHTFKNTNLNTKNAGSKINVETDIIGKHVRRLLDSQSGGVTFKKLQEHGF